MTGLSGKLTIAGITLALIAGLIALESTSTAVAEERANLSQEAGAEKKGAQSPPSPCCEEPPPPPKKEEISDDCCDVPAPAEGTDPHADRAVSIGEIPDTACLDQNGTPLSFRSDLLEGKTVAINFFFSTCKTICPPLTATFRKVQLELGEELGKDVRLISISVDPGNDVPARLKEFSAMFGADEGWSFLTGKKQEIDGLLYALGAATPEKFDHTPMILVGNLGSGEWQRTYGLAPASKIVEVIAGVDARAKDAALEREAAAYFPNRILVDQHGTKVRFYDDLLRDRMVVMHVMFTRCTSICPPLLTNLAKVTELLGDRLGRDVELISITVDPAYDTPENLLEYSRAFGAPAGWRFLTGKPDDVKAVLEKLGAWVDDPDAHNAWLILWTGRT